VGALLYVTAYVIVAVAITLFLGSISLGLAGALVAVLYWREFSR
jgi:hypothetical protein